MALETNLYNFLTDGATPVEKKRISKFIKDLEDYNDDRGYIIDPDQASRRSPKGFHYWNIDDAIIGIICRAGFKPEELRKIRFPRGMRKEIFESVGTYDQNIDIHTINNLKVTPKALSNYIRRWGSDHILKEEEW